MWKTFVRVILLHPIEAKVWLSKDERGYRLPSYTYTYKERAYLTDQYEGAFIPGLQEVCGCPLYLMKSVDQWEDVNCQRARFIGVFGIREGLPKHGEWVDLEAMSLGTFAVRKHGELVQQVLRELETEESVRPACPWQYRGWFEHAVAWIEQELLRLGHGSVTDIEQRRTTTDSAILHAQTNHGGFYFKAVANRHKFTNEPVLANALATQYPHLIPKPICIDPERRWMLTPEFGPVIDDPERDIDLLTQAVYTYGQVQLDSATHTTDFLQGDPLGLGLDHFYATVEALIKNKAEILEPEEVDAFYRHLPLIKEHIQELAGSPIPQTILHGDLGPHNIAQQNGRPVIFDWTRACVSFPFFDLFELLYRVRPRFPATSVPSRESNLGALNPTQDALKTAYLSAWTACAPLSELERLWSIAEPLGNLFLASHDSEVVRLALRSIAGD